MWYIWYVVGAMVVCGMSFLIVHSSSNTLNEDDKVKGTIGAILFSVFWPFSIIFVVPTFIIMLVMMYSRKKK